MFVCLVCIGAHNSKVAFGLKIGSYLYLGPIFGSSAIFEIDFLNWLD